MSHDETSEITARGICVFGSAILRVSPDIATINVAVTRTEKAPESAFSKARDGAKAVHAYLHSARIKDFGSSRVTLAEEFNFVGNGRKFIGYTAKIGIEVILREIDKVDVVLSGLIAAGANELKSVSFGTTRLKELRAEARRRAVAAAHEKAELYGAAANVAVGKVLLLEDVNPEVLSGRSEGHMLREPAPADDSSELGSIDPGAIVVGAAVKICYQIRSNN